MYERFAADPAPALPFRGRGSRSRGHRAGSARRSRGEAPVPATAAARAFATAAAVYGSHHHINKPASQYVFASGAGGATPLAAALGGARALDTTHRCQRAGAERGWRGLGTGRAVGCGDGSGAGTGAQLLRPGGWHCGQAACARCAREAAAATA